MVGVLAEMMGRWGKFRDFLSGRIGDDVDIRGGVLGPVFASFLVNLLSLALPLVILQVYDRIIPNHSFGTLSFLIAGLLVVLALDAMLRLIRSYSLGWAAARLDHHAICAAARHLLHADTAAIERESQGKHLACFGAIDTLREFHSGQAKSLIVDLPFVVLFLALIAFIGGPLVVVPLLLLVVLGAVAVSMARKLKGVMETRTRHDEHRHNFVYEVLSGIGSVKALGLESPMQRRFERLQKNYAATSYDATYLSNLTNNIGVVFSNAMMISVASAGALLVIDDRLTIGSLAACTLLAGRIVQPILRATGMVAQIQSYNLARRHVAEIFALPLEFPGAGKCLESAAGAIEFADVSFRYGEDRANVIKGLNLKIDPGDTISIAGEYGSGKSTFLALLMGLRKPTQGEIRVDGIDIGELDPVAYRRNFAYMSHSPLLLRGTILENLAYFRKGEAIDAGIEAARMVGLDSVINRLPQGYDTAVGDGGDGRLPAGVVQTISNARALAGNPRIVVFDEAQSGLDRRSDEELHRVLTSLKGKVTMIIVSQRPSLRKLADRSYRLSDGVLTEEGDARPAQASDAKGNVMKAVMEQ